MDIQTSTQVFAAYDSERDYQEKRWNADTTTSKGRHDLGEWWVYVQDYINEGLHQSSRYPDHPHATNLALDTTRKIGAMVGSYLEQTNGLSRRATFNELWGHRKPQADRGSPAKNLLVMSVIARMGIEAWAEKNTMSMSASKLAMKQIGSHCLVSLERYGAPLRPKLVSPAELPGMIFKPGEAIAVAHTIKAD